MSTVRQSLFLSSLLNYYTVALQVVSTLIISRLLTPAEIGIYAVAAVLAALAGQLRDFGLQEYLIQEKDLTPARIRSAFGMNIVTSWSMAALFLVLSAAAGAFYRQPGIADVMRVQAACLVLVPFGAITTAYFRREMNYRPALVIGVLGSTASFVVSIGLVTAGFSYMSLAWANLAAVVTSVLAAAWFRPPSLPRFPSFLGLGEVFRFSRHATGIYVFGQIGKGAPEAVIGRVLDVASVAFFSRAYGMIELFHRAIVRPTMEVCLPYFAKSSRAGLEPRQAYLRATVLLTGIGWPFLISVGAVAYSAIRLLYGPQWAESVPLAQVMCAAAVIELLYWLGSEVMIAEGRVDLAHRLQVAVQATRIAGVLLVIPFGLQGVCWGLLLAAVCNAFVTHRFLRRVIGLDFKELLRACKPSLLTALASSLPALLIFTFVPQHDGNFVRVVLGTGGLTAVAWLVSVRAFRHPFWDEMVALRARFAGRREPD